MKIVLAKKEQQLKNFLLMVLGVSQVLYLSTAIANAARLPSKKTLTEQLREKAEAAQARTPEETKKIMSSAIEELRKSDILSKSLKVGDQMPLFTLPDVKKGDVTAKSLLAKGPLVVVFYRGGWCPYCNLQLHDLQGHLQEFKELGAELVAISPQTPDSSLSTVQKADLSFYVLSDVGNKVAKKFGLVFRLPDDLKKVYKDFGIDLESVNASKDWELPVSATYIVKPDGKVAYAFADVDYKKRAETEELLKILKSLKE